MDKEEIRAVLTSGAIVLGIFAAIFYLFPGGGLKKPIKQIKSTKQITEITRSAPSKSKLETQIIDDSYIVQKDDSPSKIFYERGFRRKEIYRKCWELQAINNFGPERDVYKVVDGKLVPGKDGCADVLYPGEKIKILD